MGQSELFHNNNTRHVWMNLAVIGVFAGLGECVRELVVRIQTFRRKTLVVAGHGMRRLVVIGPDDLGPGLDRDFLRRAQMPLRAN